jgi:sucrose phosphorylase
VHILPFFPFTSDDGFAVTDYEQVNSKLGDWADINRIGDEFRLMSDLVLNHMSSQSKWFNEYLQGHPPYDKYFFEASPSDDLSSVVGRGRIRCCARWRPPAARAMSGAPSPSTRWI